MGFILGPCFVMYVVLSVPYNFANISPRIRELTMGGSRVGNRGSGPPENKKDRIS